MIYSWGYFNGLKDRQLKKIPGHSLNKRFRHFLLGLHRLFSTKNTCFQVLSITSDSFFKRFGFLGLPRCIVLFPAITSPFPVHLHMPAALTFLHLKDSVIPELFLTNPRLSLFISESEACRTGGGGGGGASSGLGHPHGIYIGGGHPISIER